MINMRNPDQNLAPWLHQHHSTLTPTALYVHLPWCVSKCPYCDFNSHGLKGQTFPQQAYVNALLTELKLASQSFQNRQIISIFFGGGTPSLFSANSIAQIITCVCEHFHTAQQMEVTLEANPGTTDQAHFAGYIAAGVNRISLGIQSFNPSHLKALGRIHDDKQAYLAINDAKQVGFMHINLDLMFALPKQSPPEALHDLQLAINANVCHISWYQLTLEPHTPFANNPPPLPMHDDSADITEQGHLLLQENGFEQIEISAFAKPGHICQHNLHIWNFGDYLGIGAGAHSKLTINKKVMRCYRHYHPKQYLAADEKIASSYQLEKKDIIFEYLLNRLRVYQPFSNHHFTQQTGASKIELQTVLEQAQQQALISQNAEGYWEPTLLGRAMHNDLLLLCIPNDL